MHLPHLMLILVGNYVDSIKIIDELNDTYEIDVEKNDGPTSEKAVMRRYHIYQN